MQLQQVLYSQGFGTRRICAGLIEQGLVAIGGTPCTDPQEEVMAEGLRFAVQGHEWTYHEKAYLMLHKPAGYECSRKPSAWPSVHSLLPAPLRQRPQRQGMDGVQAVGRLDQDTTGLLLLSDDGAFIHRMSSPKRQMPKVYQATTRHAIDDEMVRRLLEGVVLDDDPRPVRAAACRQLGSHDLELTLTQGKYHQVKRMVAASGNRVERLHRSRIGGLELPRDLAPGQWQWLDAADLERLQAG